MKKILAVFLALVVLMGAYLFYQRQQVASSLQELLKGKTYSSYGIKIEIPPSEGSVQGWLKPYVNLPRVVLDLSTWGLKQPISFENAIASRKLWSRGGILLEMPREVSPQKNIKIVKPYAELAAEDKIIAFASEVIEFSESPRENKKVASIKISHPKLLMQNWVGGFPDYKISWDKALYQEGAPFKIELGALSLGSKSYVEKGRRHFEFLFQQQGGTYQNDINDEERGDIGALEYRMRGELKDLSESDHKNLNVEVEKFKLLALELEKNISAPAGFMVVNQLLTERLPQFVEQMNGILTTLDIKFKDVDLSWQGFSMKSQEDQKRILIQPVTIHQDFQYFEKGFGWKATGELKKVELAWDEDLTLLEGLHYRQESKYQNVSFLELTNFYITRLKENPFFNLAENQSLDTRQLLISVLAYLAQYPEEQHFFLSLDNLEYRDSNFYKIHDVKHYTTKFQAIHKNSVFSFYMEPEKVGYEFKGNFDWRYLENDKAKKTFQSPIEGGKFRLAIEVILPWDDLLAVVRQAASGSLAGDTSQLLQGIATVFSGKTTQYNTNILVDLGKNYFNFNWDIFASVPVGEALTKLELPESMAESDYKLMEQKLVPFRQVWIEQSNVKSQVDIARFSKFQKFLDEMQPGTSLGLALLAPYVQIDSKADTLKSQIEYKDKQILVNGAPNVTLNQMLAPYLEK